MNDDILVPSRIEAERTKQTLIVRGLFFLKRWKLIFFSDKKTRKRKSQGKEKGGNEAPAIQWPPKRQHHKPPPRPTDQLRLSNPRKKTSTDLIFRLASRHQALVQLGMINSPSDVPAFARDLQVFFSFFPFLFQFINPSNYFLLVRGNLKKLNERFLRSWIGGQRCRLTRMTRIRVRIDEAFFLGSWSLSNLFKLL